MRIIRNSILPFKKFDAINILGLVFCHHDTKITASLIRHERIHTRQMWELLVIGYYIWYIAEWLVRLPRKGCAYRNISFEKEAYKHMYDAQYLSERRPFAWIKYLKGNKREN